MTQTTFTAINKMAVMRDCDGIRVRRSALNNFLQTVTVPEYSSGIFISKAREVREGPRQSHRWGKCLTNWWTAQVLGARFNEITARVLVPSAMFCMLCDIGLPKITLGDIWQDDIYPGWHSASPRTTFTPWASVAVIFLTSWAWFSCFHRPLTPNR